MADDWGTQLIALVFLGVLAAACYGGYKAWEAWRGEDPGCFYFVRMGTGIEVLTKDPGASCATTETFIAPRFRHSVAALFPVGDELKAAQFARDCGRKVCRVTDWASACP